MSELSVAGQLADTLADGGWRAKARPSQLLPAGPWNGALVCCGRGFGKNRMASEFIHEEVQAKRVGRIALVAPTAADARDTICEGESGILQTAPSWCRPEYEPSKRKLTWPNGAIAHTFSSEEPDRIRGFNFDFAFADELAAWHDPQATWDMLMFALRLGGRPRWLVTTTPRPIKLLKDLLAREGSDVIVIRGSTLENSANLAPTFLQSIQSKYSNTRLGKQEIEGLLLSDTPNALWTHDMIEKANNVGRLPDMQRVVVAIDPSGTAGASDRGDFVGIIVGGLGVDAVGYILADRTCKLSPDGWGRRAVDAYREFKADKICAERNFGGAMVEAVLRAVDPNMPYKELTASRGKVARAEPIAALFEQNKIRFAHRMPELEEQLLAMTSAGYVGDGSPDRADAMVWALHELFGSPEPGIIGYARNEAARATADQIGNGKTTEPPSLTNGGVRMQSPNGASTAYGMTGTQYNADAEGTFIVAAGDVRPLLAAGWVAVRMEVADG